MKNHKKSKAENTFIVEQVEVGKMQNFSYILLDKTTKKCALIDPGWDPKKLIQHIDDIGTLDKILLTHSHYDHMQYAKAISDATKRQVLIQKETPKTATKGIELLKTFKDGENITLGKTKIKAIHTPGHTIECTCFLAGDILFTGDTLFVNSCGRVDLPTGDAATLFKSINEKIKKLPDETKVYPGHNYGYNSTSTIGREKKHNPCMRCRTVEEFLKLFG
jgi:glyoxylase-like metal-dependent hydrolase (beta-lactamase superfamily II)